MSSYLQLGALDIKTNEYILPSKAIKGREYKCIDCDKNVILRKGEIRRPHFAHYTQTNTCHYYDHPNEAQIHKDAKKLMAQLLKDKKQILFTWDCKHCGGFYEFDNDESTIIYKEGDEVVIEYRSKDNKWIADIAIINNNEVRYIIEIKNTHATVSERPEPWFEVNARRLIEEVNRENEEYIRYLNECKEDKMEPSKISYRIPCIRNIDRYCYGSFCYKEPWVRKIPGYDKTLKDNSCILCHKEEYEPASDGSTGKFQGGNIRVCHDCLFKDSYEKKLRELYNGEMSIYKDLRATFKTGGIEKPKKIPVSENELLLKVPTLMSRAGSNQSWKQDAPCTSCGRYQYSPVYDNRKYYAICKICLGDPQVRINTDRKIIETKISNHPKCMIKF